MINSFGNNFVSTYVLNTICRNTICLNSYTDDIIILLNIIFTGLHGYQNTPGLSTNKQRHRLLLLRTEIHVAPTHLYLSNAQFWQYSRVTGDSLLIHEFAYSLLIGLCSVTSNMTCYSHSYHSIKLIHWGAPQRDLLSN